MFPRQFEKNFRTQAEEVLCIREFKDEMSTHMTFRDP